MNGSIFAAVDASAAAAPRQSPPLLRRRRSRRPRRSSAPTPKRTRLPMLILCGLAGIAGLAGAMPPRLAAAAAPAAGVRAPSVPAAAKGLQADPLPTIALEEVKVGQHGYGLSGFAGGQPQRFDVEVVCLMRHITPDMSS